MTQEISTPKKEQTVNASFQQKSAGVSLVIVASAAMYYVAKAWPMRQIALDGTPIPSGFGGLVLTTFGLVVLAEIVLQIVLIIGAGSAPKANSHEQLASLKANRNANGVLTAGVLAVVGVLFAGFPAFCLANIAMIALFAAEIVKITSQLIYGRAG